MTNQFRWARFDPNGYEVSTKGDKRFSALNAIMPDGRTIEMWYQCDIKGYDIRSSKRSHSRGLNHDYQRKHRCGSQR